MASHILNALTLRHDHDAAERTLRHFWDTKDLFDSELIDEHIASQPLLAASLFCLVACSFGLVIFAAVFLTCRLRGQCGSQKYQEYPSNSTNYAVYLMLFFISWIIVTSASAYFVLAGAGFWSEKLEPRKPIPYLTNSSIVRLSRSVISDLFSNYDYHGDFENVSESSKTLKKLKRIHIRRQPPQSFRKRIEIPYRPIAEMQFKESPEKFTPKNRESARQILEHQDKVSVITDTVKTGGNNIHDWNDSSEASAVATDTEDSVLVVTGETMTIESTAGGLDASQSTEYEDSSENYSSSTEVSIATTFLPKTPTTTQKTMRTPFTIAPESKTTTIPTSTTEPVRTTVTTSQLFPEVKWEKMLESNNEDVLDQLLSTSTDTKNTLIHSSNLAYFSLHSRLLVFICRLAFCLVALLLALVILPTFFLVVAGTGCYIYSDHPMNRSSVSNKIGQAVSVNASILLFASPCILVFSSFALFYTHCHELLCAAIQLQHQKTSGMVDQSHQSLIETYSINTNQCSRSLAPVQSLLLSSLLVCVSTLPCVFAMFKLVKYYFRMSSEFYWNAADNFAGRQYSKQEFPRYQSTVIYPDDDLTAGYAVYGQI